jgi:thymidylate kinase
MPSVALIGPDGAGKTTLAHQLEASATVPCRYLYMGVAIGSSNVALPTSRLLQGLKQRRRAAAGRTSAAGGALPAPAVGPAARTGVKHSLRAAARLANLLVEAGYRQLVSWSLQARGFVVLYDRHYLFDYAPEVVGTRGGLCENRARRFLLRHLLPRPDLVIFLDAPGDVLFARKGELTVPELERRRQAFLAQGERLPNFVRVDATRPQQEVYAAAAVLLAELLRRSRLPNVLEGNS